MTIYSIQFTRLNIQNENEMKKCLVLICLLLPLFFVSTPVAAQEDDPTADATFHGLKWRNIGPFRGGRSVASTGIPGQPNTYLMGTCGGGIWRTEDAGVTWKNISDGFLNTGSVGAIAVAPSDPNVVYVGMGEHAVRGVMTSHGDGVYKSTDGGDTWVHLGLEKSRHIAEIRIHPANPDLVYVAVQGAAHGPTEDRGVYRSSDGGNTWEKILYVDENTGAADLSMDVNNPRVLYAGMWDHLRAPWQVRSGGPGSGIHKSVDGGETWTELTKGLPAELGKVSVDVSPANSDVVYANVEAEGEKAGVYRSNDGGESWKQTTSDRITVARAWYYIEIFADPADENKVYVLNAPMLKSIDGGKTFESIRNPHGDQHHLWINPDNPDNIILSNDGGACITFNGGLTWSSQQNQPTAQFYRIITDNRFPYHVYAGQQDNSTVCTASRTNGGRGGGIGWKDWYAVAGCESAFLAFDPDNPELVYGGCYQGNISVYDHRTNEMRDIMAYPTAVLAWTPKDMKFRFNWNAPIVASPQDYNTIYHAGNRVLKTTNGGLKWEVISPDLTKNEVAKQDLGGVPFTNEGAGGEVYNTISYLEASEHDAGVLWSGSDCGLVHVTRDGGENWTNVTPKGLGEALINCIDVSPHNPAAAYMVATKYKFNDFTPMVYYTDNYGKSWKKIVNGIADEAFVRVVREDLKQPGLLYAGTELGMYISFDNGENWEDFQLNLPTCPITDLTFRDNDLVVATMGRAFWILDDLGAIQQSMGRFDEEIKVFASKPTPRVAGGGGRGDVGKNPPAGVLIDYYLPENMDSTTLKMEIVDAQGRVVRTYTNQKDKDYVKYDGGPAAEKMITSKKGVNRINWDFRRSILPGVEKVFVLGSYNGSHVGPGAFTIRLTADDKTVESTAEVTPDPRLNVTAQDYEAQQEVLQSLHNAAIEVHESVNRMRKLKSQVKALLDPVKELDAAKELVEKGKQLMKKIEDWEDHLIQKDQKTFQDVINFPNKLNAEIMSLINRVDSHDPGITEGAGERVRDLNQEWSQRKTEMMQILELDVKQFNKLYKDTDIPALALPDKA